VASVQQQVSSVQQQPILTCGVFFAQQVAADDLNMDDPTCADVGLRPAEKQVYTNQ
jgi:hypothetical protein